jgi:hypothetical protein
MSPGVTFLSFTNSTLSSLLISYRYDSYRYERSAAIVKTNIESSR